MAIARDIDAERLLELSRRRVMEATILLDAGCPNGAYYLAGYAVELRLKAIVAMSFQAGVIPDWQRVREVFTHNLDELARLAGVRDTIREAVRSRPGFAANWAVVRDWSEVSRYSQSSRASAQELINAITDPADGVLAWLNESFPSTA